MRTDLKRWSRRLLASASLLALGWLAAPAVAGIVCYRISVTSWTQSGPAGGGCSTYTNCPDRILCTEGEIFEHAGTIAFTVIQCDTYSGGTWDPVKKACTGGTKVGSSQSVTIPVQTCSGSCN
jgi:hypothetical protein